MQSVGTDEFNLENIRKHLQRLSDEELIQFGKACRDMLTRQANLGRPPREVFVIQLQEARKEWRRRHPKNAGRLRPLSRLPLYPASNDPERCEISPAFHKRRWLCPEVPTWLGLPDGTSTRLAYVNFLHCGDTESHSKGELIVLCDVHKGFHEFLGGASYEDTEALRNVWEFFRGRRSICNSPLTTTSMYLPPSKNCITFFPLLATAAQRDFVSGFCSSPGDSVSLNRQSICLSRCFAVYRTGKLSPSSENAFLFSTSDCR